MSKMYQQYDRQRVDDVDPKDRDNYPISTISGISDKQVQRQTPPKSSVKIKEMDSDKPHEATITEEDENEVENAEEDETEDENAEAENEEKKDENDKKVAEAEVASKQDGDSNQEVAKETEEPKGLVNGHQEEVSEELEGASAPVETGINSHFMSITRQ